MCGPLHRQAQDVLSIPPNALLIRRIFNQASELGAIPRPMWNSRHCSPPVPLGGSVPGSGTSLTSVLRKTLYRSPELSGLCAAVSSLGLCPVTSGCLGLCGLSASSLKLSQLASSGLYTASPSLCGLQTLSVQ